jgi:hypothetical protein
VLAHAADNFGMKELSQFMDEIHFGYLCQQSPSSRAQSRDPVAKSLR